MTTALFMLSFLTACATLFLFHSSFSFSLLLVYAFTPSLHSASSFFFTCATFFPFRSLLVIFPPIPFRHRVFLFVIHPKRVCQCHLALPCL
ncbi:hypothetical protein BDB00DRAFT_865638, partial [Zychaea mexicana]|uniref:uncharacterized protein n=1 Tax=Zychaea mexicana TaxID=64656 RepID=UPI0022FF3F50